jgi:hypothetical protein
VSVVAELADGIVSFIQANILHAIAKVGCGATFGDSHTKFNRPRETREIIPSRSGARACHRMRHQIPIFRQPIISVTWKAYVFA